MEENVRLTVEILRRDSYDVQRAIERNELELIGAVYDMVAGEIYLLN